MFIELMQALTGVFVLVYEGQHALLFQLGRARRVVGPGIHFKLPIIQKFVVKDTRHTTLDLEPQVIQLKDQLVFEVDCKLVYQITDLKKAVIEIDSLQDGLKNRVVMAVQEVVRSKDRRSVAHTDQLIAEVRERLSSVERDWGVRIHQFGFSNLSPSPATLEITQLDLLAREKLRLYRVCKDEGLSDEAAVGLITGAVVALDASPMSAGAPRPPVVRAAPPVEDEGADGEGA